MKSNKNPGTTLYFSQFGGERPIPEKFIAAMNRAEKRTKVNKDVELPELSDEIIEARFDTRYENTNDKQLVVITKKKGRIGPLRDIRTTDQGRSVQVEAIMFRTADATFVRSYPSAMQDVGINDLGNGWSIQEVAIEGTFDDNGIFTPGIYQGVELTTKKDDPLPGWLTKGVDEKETQSITEGTVVQPVLMGNDLVASERQTAESKKLLSRLTRDNVTLPANQQFVKQIEDLLPARFRGLVPTTRQVSAVSGTVSDPTLGPGELMRSEEQFSTLVKLVEVLTRAGVTFPISVVETATITEYGGGKVTITSNIAVVGTYAVDEGEGIVSSKISKLGEGHELKETVARVAAAWPILPFSRFDARLQMVVSGTKQVVGKGTTTPGVSSGVITEVEDIDGYRERRIITTQPLSVVDSYIRILPGNNTNVDVPPFLYALTGHVQVGGEAGSYSETGTYSISAGGGSGGIQLHGTAQASAACLPELSWEVRIPRTSNRPCIHVLFYVANSASRASIISTLSGILNAASFGTCSAWPDFRPQQVIVKGIGGKVNINGTVNVSAHDSITTDYLGAIKYNGASRSNGAGSEIDINLSIKMFTIPPTIHNVLSVGGAWTDSVNKKANGTINGGVAGAIGTTGDLWAHAEAVLTIESGVAATTGDSSIPASGLRVHRLVTEPDPVYPRLRVFAEVVEFADITP